MPIFSALQKEPGFVTADEGKSIFLLFQELKKPVEEPLLWHGIC